MLIRTEVDIAAQAEAEIAALESFEGFKYRYSRELPLSVNRKAKYVNLASAREIAHTDPLDSMEIRRNTLLMPGILPPVLKYV